MKTSLVPVFPGSNCEKETVLWLNDNLETKAEFLDLSEHGNLNPESIHAVIIPGGFSYGDYLRAGAIAARSKEMEFITKLSSYNIPIMGICNGFQILCESKLLPGILVKNVTRQHHHFPVSIKVDPEYLLQNSSKNCLWIPKVTKIKYQQSQKRFENFDIPMSCGMGNWQPPLDAVEKEIALQNAVIYYNKNENGSYKAIAGITNTNGNVLGLMPHPERASDSVLGSIEGLLFLYGVAKNKHISIKKNSELEKFVKSFS